MAFGDLIENIYNNITPIDYVNILKISAGLTILLIIILMGCCTNKPITYKKCDKDNVICEDKVIGVKTLRGMVLLFSIVIGLLLIIFLSNWSFIINNPKLATGLFIVSWSFMIIRNLFCK
jgi:hypothetical protein